MAENPQQQSQDPQPQQYAQQPTDWQAAQQQGFAAQPTQPVAQAHVNPVTWTSAEYISHAKTNSWYLLFAVGVVAITAVIYLVTKEVLASVAILVVAASAGFFSARPPASRSYEINQDELIIDGRSYSLDTFKSFSVVEEGNKDSIWLKPIKRFAPFQIVYFNAKDEQRIIDILSKLLPHEERELDRLDVISKKLKF